MFGYVRPCKPELKVREFERFKSCYCSLCHRLGSEYGFAARFLLNYDFTFLTMLLWGEGCEADYEMRGCIMRPCPRRLVCKATEATEISAGYSIILARWKLKDAYNDGRFGQKIASAAAMLMTSRAYRKAKRRYPDFDEKVRLGLEKLSAMEKSGERSIDRTADSFAAILAAAAEGEKDSARRRILGQLLYHLGRWIYIVDAVDDLEEDHRDGLYNPIAARFGLSDGVLQDADREYIRNLLGHSRNMMSSALELMPEGVWSEILRNTIYLGLQDVEDAVFDGSFMNTRERLPRL